MDLCFQGQIAPLWMDVDHLAFQLPRRVQFPWKLSLPADESVRDKGDPVSPPDVSGDLRRLRAGGVLIAQDITSSQNGRSGSGPGSSWNPSIAT